MAYGLIKVGDKYYKSSAAEMILKNMDLVVRTSDDIGKFIRDSEDEYRDCLKKYFVDKISNNADINMSDKAIEDMTDELTELMITTIEMTSKLTIHPISAIIDNYILTDEEVESIEREKVERREADKFRKQFKDCKQIQCAKCKKMIDFDKIELDHIIPISEGGTSSVSNLQFLCHKCHMEKHHGKKEDN